MEHSAEFMPYVASLIGFFAVYVLNGIKSEIKEVKDSLQSLERDMREGVSSLDRRVSVIEARCAARHSEGGQ